MYNKMVKCINIEVYIQPHTDSNIPASNDKGKITRPSKTCARVLPFIMYLKVKNRRTPD